MVLLSVPLVVMNVIGVIGKAVGKECVLLSVVSLCVSIVVFVVGVVVSDGVTITVVSLVVVSVAVVVSVVVISVVVVASVVVNDGDGGAKDVKDEEEGRREEEEDGLNDVVDGVDSDGFDGGFVPIEDDGLLISNGHWSPLEAEI
uniref:Uncharacterized protein n=1 Tax=Ascaris lumbricoides TaxID=6252 RepID=A0A0M3IBT3_ASCLU